MFRKLLLLGVIAAAAATAKAQWPDIQRYLRMRNM